MGKSVIAWTNKTWPVGAGCTRVSTECLNCYAFAIHDRRHAMYKANNGLWPHSGLPMPAQYALPFSEVQMLDRNLEQPLHWRSPARVFVGSMTDLFHSKMTDEYILKVFEIMGRCPQHTFQVLTKRTGRLKHLWPHLPWYPNIWIGQSVGSDQFTPRLNVLRQIPAAVRFVSTEPLLSDVPSMNLDGIDWVIAGGESGAGFRPMALDWVRHLRDRCVAANVAFFYKQGASFRSGMYTELDGRTWAEYPTPQDRGWRP